jgi:hypothetical protein
MAARRFLLLHLEMIEYGVQYVAFVRACDYMLQTRGTSPLDPLTEVSFRIAAGVLLLVWARYFVLSTLLMRPAVYNWLSWQMCAVAARGGVNHARCIRSGELVYAGVTDPAIVPHVVVFALYVLVVAIRVFHRKFYEKPHVPV